MAVADRADAESTDLPPLYEAVEPDALDALFQATADGVPRAGGEVRFSYAGYRVAISMGQGIEIDVVEA